MRPEANHIKPLLCALFLLAVSCTAAIGKVIYVDADAIGANNGSNWENAYLCLQDALEDVDEDFHHALEGDLFEAQSGYEIRVANGIYKPDRRTSEGPHGKPLITASGDWTNAFRISATTVRGAYAGYGEPDPNARDIYLYETILSGDLYGNDVQVNDPEDLREEPSRAENSFQVVIAEGNSVIDGLTITGGNANDPSDSHHTSSGGGLLKSGWFDTLQITNCTFTGNSALSKKGAGYTKIVATQV